jgi:tetratricopeptide (TPR) repeat protein
VEQLVELVEQSRASGFSPTRDLLKEWVVSYPQGRANLCNANLNGADLSKAELWEANLTEAEPLYARAIAIGEKTLGPEHPDLAARFNNLANLYQDTGRYAEAEPLFQRAIAIGEKTLGPEHPNVSVIRSALSALKSKQSEGFLGKPWTQLIKQALRQVLNLNNKSS